MLKANCYEGIFVLVVLKGSPRRVQGTCPRIDIKRRNYFMNFVDENIRNWSFHLMVEVDVVSDYLVAVAF